MNMLIVLGVILLFVSIMTVIFYIQKPWLDETVAAQGCGNKKSATRLCRFMVTERSIVGALIVLKQDFNKIKRLPRLFSW